MRMLRKTMMFGLLFGTFSFLSWAGGASPLFDKPLHETHTPLPLDPDNPQSKPMLSCFYYQDFMVKQVDLGEEGAEQLSILHVQKGQTDPPCSRANAKDEIVIDSKTWSGYFEGVKGDFVFFHAEDGFNDGLSFAVFNGWDGYKLFEDAAKLDKSVIAFAEIKLLIDPKSDPETAIRLRYRRVYVAQCSLRADEKDCWKNIQQITGLTEAMPPSCEAAYEAEKKRLPKYANMVDTYPSNITYEVEVVLNRRNSVVRVTPISKAMECYLGD